MGCRVRGEGREVRRLGCKVRGEGREVRGVGCRLEKIGAYPQCLKRCGGSRDRRFVCGRPALPDWRKSAHARECLREKRGVKERTGQGGSERARARE